MYENRRAAGAKLARALEEYRNRSALVLAIPRGGVEVAYQVAEHLDADLSLLVSRKLPFPHNPEAGFGAIAEDGSTFIFEDFARGLPPKTVNRIVEEQEREIERRIDTLRQGRRLPDIEGRTVILVDDGIAMGSTMRAAIKMCRKREAAKIVVAVPVASPRVAAEMSAVADEVVIPEQPMYFRAVAQAYRQWYDVSDGEVIGIMEKWRSRETHV